MTNKNYIAYAVVFGISAVVGVYGVIISPYGNSPVPSWLILIILGTVGIGLGSGGMLSTDLKE